MESRKESTRVLLFWTAALVILAAQPGWSQWKVLNGPYAQCTIGPTNPYLLGTGLATLPDGRVLISTPKGLFWYPGLPSAPGQCPTTAPFLLKSDQYGRLTIGLDGNVYALNATNGKVNIVRVNLNSVVDNDTTLVSDTNGLDMTLDPYTGDLYFTADDDTIYRVANPTTCYPACKSEQWTTVSMAAFDGLAWSCDGKYLFAADQNTNELYRFDRQKGYISANIPGGPDGVAVGAAGTPLGGYVFTNNHDGTVTRLNLALTSQFNIVSGGARGDFLFVDGQGSLVAVQGQSDEHLQRLFSTIGGQWVKPGASLCSTLGCGARAVTTNQIDRPPCFDFDESVFANLVVTLSQTACGTCETCYTLNQSRSSLIALLNFLDPPKTCLDGLKAAANALYNSCPCNPNVNACAVPCTTCNNWQTELWMHPAVAREESALGVNLDSYDPELKVFLTEVSRK